MTNFSLEIPADSLAPASRWRIPPFWAAQMVGWSAYGIALMLPWIGTFPVRLMAPSKVVIAGSGLLVATVLREVYRAAARHGSGPAATAAAMVAASVAGGLLWNAMIRTLVGAPAGGGSLTGVIEGGVPTLAGGLYHAVVMLAWSAAYVGVRHARARRATVPGAAATVIARDGRRSVLLAPEEIDWIEADGDYVRVHAGAKRILVRDTMKRVETELPAGEFLRIHRSAIVRVARVTELRALPNRECEVLLRDGTRLRASRTYAGRLRDALRLAR